MTLDSCVERDRFLCYFNSKYYRCETVSRSYLSYYLFLPALAPLSMAFEIWTFVSTANTPLAPPPVSTSPNFIASLLGNHWLFL